MAISYSCDYCGEPIEDRCKVELRGSGESEVAGRYPDFVHGTVGTYHATIERPCWAEMLDRISMIHEVSTDLGLGATALKERTRHESWQDTCRARQAADDEQLTEYRKRKAAWQKMGWDERFKMFLRVLGNDQMTGSEVTAAMNSELGVAESDCYVVLGTGNVRQLASRMVREGKLQEELEIVSNRPRYRYFRSREAVA